GHHGDAPPATRAAYREIRAQTVGLTQAIILRSRAPTSSIGCAAHSACSLVKFGLPASSSATHSRANEPSWISARILLISSFTCGPITRGPRVRSPYSAVSDTE